MKKLIAFLLLVPSLCLAAAGDYGIDRRNVTNNNWEKVLLISPSTTGLLGYDPVTKLSAWLTPGANIQISSGMISATAPAPTWSAIVDKPNFSPVATTGAYTDLSGKPALFSGAYADLSGKPTIPAAQVNSDWSAVSGVSQILNKPILFTGAYSDLTGKPALFDGAYSSLSGVPSSFLPAAHTHSAGDIVNGILAVERIPSLSISQTVGLQTALDSKFTAPSGNASQYLRGDGSTATFPAVPAAQVNADWNAVSGISQILNKPVLFSGAYSDLTGKPAIPAAQVQSDWNAVSAPAAILNKPVLFSGAYSALTGIPSTFVPAAHTQAFSTITATPTTLGGYGITDGLTSAALMPYATTVALTSGLAAKFNTPAGTTSQYVRGDGTLAALPVAKRIETYAGTTNAQGQVTVVYATAFAAAPIVQPPAPAAANQVWTTVSNTTTGFTLQLNQRNSINLLNVDVLLGATVPVAGTAAQFLVVAP